MIDALLDRSLYPGLKDYVYLNQASLGLIAQPAVAAMHHFLDDVARHGNYRMTDDEEVGFLTSLRERGAKLLHCNPAHLAIVASASEMLGQLPFLISPKAGSAIVAVSSDFPAVTRPWIRYAAEHNCTLRYVDDLAIENLTDHRIDSIDEQTSVVVVSSVQFATGSRIDVPRLREATSRHNAHLVVDATQAAGILNIDAKQWQADAIITSGYKWLGGHGGVALAVVAPHLLEKIPLLPGWMGTAQPFAFEATQLGFADDARRFTQSTMSYISMAGLTAAIDQLLSIGQPQIEAHARRLSEQLIQAAKAQGWTSFREATDPSASPHIVTLTHPALNAERIVAALQTNKIVCGFRNGRLRISLAPYNNSDDVKALIAVLSEV